MPWFQVPPFRFSFIGKKDPQNNKQKHLIGIQTMAVVNGLQAATGTQLENLINKCECCVEDATWHHRLAARKRKGGG